MGILSIIRAKRQKIQSSRVEKLRAASGDRRAQLELLKEERKLLQEKENLRKEKEQVRDLRFAPLKRFAKGVKKKAQAANKRIADRTDKTAQVFGGTSSTNVFSGGSNPFVEAPKEKKKKSVVIKIEQ